MTDRGYPQGIDRLVVSVTYGQPECELGWQPRLENALLGTLYVVGNAAKLNFINGQAGGCRGCYLTHHGI